MMGALAKKKRIQVGHKVSTTQTIQQIEDILGSEEPPNKERLFLLQLTFNGEIETVKPLDTNVIELIDEEDLF